ncbi:MAG TPA: hypothetical protein VHJ20_17645 [Polyangia bacterium]|nr:hypothetical protein [Polyangia bacterium]
MNHLSRVPSTTQVLRLATLALLTASLEGCASLRWPDEPGVPVLANHDDDARAAKVFVDALAGGHGAAPKLERSLEPIAASLQAGVLSAGEALRAGGLWGGEAYATDDVDAWVLDCTVGHPFEVPKRLLSAKTVAISFAPAHFRPQSSATEQCAIIVVAVRGSHDVAMRAVDLL